MLKNNTNKVKLVEKLLNVLRSIQL